ncbi:MAG: hypothetical protein PHI27_01715 [Eubacteriales bacterium]|nr:hypothetical protein [Eubacteriales bacterium]MDD3880949.1 hypothetical protein [Eubacteriales bacterium]MDD4511982.1 hypothetical protein [Eubacteriales bacterium]
MHGAEYFKARKEFINCLEMSLVGLSAAIVLAFTEWYPIMREEKRKEKALKQANAAEEARA